MNVLMQQKTNKELEDDFQKAEYYLKGAADGRKLAIIEIIAAIRSWEKHANPRRGNNRKTSKQIIRLIKSLDT